VLRDRILSVIGSA